MSAATLQLLSGHWASTANTTGNFVLVFNRQVPFETLSPYPKFLHPVLGCECLTPADGWVWVHLRSVSTSDTSGRLYTNADLHGEIMRNPVMAGATFGMEQHWQPTQNLLAAYTIGMILVPVIDPQHTRVSQMIAQGLHMFGKRVKVVNAGDAPRMIQCGRCHLLGHATRSPLCKLHPAAVKCHRCGGPHHSQNHDYECKGAHRTPGKCNCKPKCLLCGQVGHHCRSRKCPKWGDFSSTLEPPPERDIPYVSSATPEAAPVALPKEIPTQREPLTAQTLPQRAISQAARKKAKAKAKKEAATPATSTPAPAPPSNNKFDVLDTLEQQRRDALTWANADPNFSMDDAIGYERPTKTEIYPSVHVTAVPPSNFYTVAEVA